ncbi:hypothetical protein B0J17DRAFT_766215 [Rhizoctonia solani]|nr:hypothetical protein B0J17DRAFT_766215 [Rhizoctonia solani]
MKVSGIISALIFAQVALGQATDSSASVSGTSSVTGSKAAASATGSKSQASSTSSTAPGATPTGSPTGLTETHTSSELLMPDGASETCSKFLKKLNSDTKAAGCLTSMNNALSSFSSGQGSADEVPKTLDRLCSSNACSDTNIPSLLTEFSDACSSDFASNQLVAMQYEVWYSIIPYRSTICAKDGGAYCLLKTTTDSSSSQNTRRSNAAYAAGHLANPVNKRDQTVLTPNIVTFRDHHLLYQFTSTDIGSEQLCTTCTQQITAEYAKFKSANNYALASSQTSLLGGGLAEFWASLAQCPLGFTDDILKLAGQEMSGAATKSASYLTALAAAFAATFTLF